MRHNVPPFGYLSITQVYYNDAGNFVQHLAWLVMNVVTLPVINEIYIRYIMIILISLEKISNGKR
jgi:hypothetical protein